MSNKTLRHTLDRSVKEVLKLVDHASRIGVPEDAHEGSRDTPETARLLRELAAESIVLLKNERKALPLNPAETVGAALTSGAAQII